MKNFRHNFKWWKNALIRRKIYEEAMGKIGETIEDMVEEIELADKEVTFYLIKQEFQNKNLLNKRKN